MPNHDVLLFDAHGVIYRAFYAFPDLSTSEGVLVNAVYGFAKIVLTSLLEHEPQYVAVAFDHPEKTLRHTTYEAYKAHRAEMPDELKPQIALVKEFVQALNIPQFEMAGYEADDLIGTVAKTIEEQHPDLSTLLVTGDKDLLQLVDDKTHVFIPSRTKGQGDTEYDADMVLQKMGVLPEQVIDLKALMGDSSDNIPGVKGIGKKTAVALLTAFPTLDAVYQAVEADASSPVLTPGVKQKLLADRENAFLSRELAQINCAVPLKFSLPDCQLVQYDKQAVLDLLEKYEFQSLIRLLPRDAFERGIQEALF